MPVVVSYDVVCAHTQVKDGLLKAGYTDFMLANLLDDPNEKGKVYLPNTTLFHASRNETTTHHEVKAVAARNSPGLKKSIAYDLPAAVTFVGIME